jgi:hypothetical protein
MILPQCLNNATVGQINNYFEPVDSVCFSSTTEEIVIESVNPEIEFNIDSDTIEVNAINEEIIVEEIDNNVETVCGC